MHKLLSFVLTTIFSTSLLGCGMSAPDAQTANTAYISEEKTPLSSTPNNQIHRIGEQFTVVQNETNEFEIIFTETEIAYDEYDGDIFAVYFTVINNGKSDINIGCADFDFYGDNYAVGDIPYNAVVSDEYKNLWFVNKTVAPGRKLDGVILTTASPNDYSSFQMQLGSVIIDVTSQSDPFSQYWGNYSGKIVADGTSSNENIAMEFLPYNIADSDCVGYVDINGVGETSSLDLYYEGSNKKIGNKSYDVCFASYYDDYLYFGFFTENEKTCVDYIIPTNSGYLTVAKLIKK